MLGRPSVDIDAHLLSCLCALVDGIEELHERKRILRGDVGWLRASDGGGKVRHFGVEVAGVVFGVFVDELTIGEDRPE